MFAIERQLGELAGVESDRGRTPATREELINSGWTIVLLKLVTTGTQGNSTAYKECYFLVKLHCSQQSNTIMGVSTMNLASQIGQRYRLQQTLI